MQTFNSSVEEVKSTSVRALYSERLNRLVTAVVMEARGIYGAKDTADARKFADGLLTGLAGIDALLSQWQPLVLEQDRALFDAVLQDAASFKAFRTETARLGTEVSPQAANAQGNNEANRANRKTFQTSIDALTQRSQAEVEIIKARTSALYEQRFWLLICLAFGGTGAALISAGLIAHRQIVHPLQGMTTAMNTLASGDTSTAIPNTGRRDELGAMAAAVEVFKDSMFGAGTWNRKQSLLGPALRRSAKQRCARWPTASRLRLAALSAWLPRLPPSCRRPRRACLVRLPRQPASPSLLPLRPRRHASNVTTVPRPLRN